MKDLYLLSDIGYVGIEEEGNTIYSTVIVGVFSSKLKAVKALKVYDTGMDINCFNTFEIERYSVDEDYL